jgi:hypothetical protein
MKIYVRTYALPPSYHRSFSNVTYINVLGLHTFNVTYSTSQVLTKTNDLYKTILPLPKF